MFDMMRLLLFSICVLRSVRVCVYVWKIRSILERNSFLHSHYQNRLYRLRSIIIRKINDVVFLINNIVKIQKSKKKPKHSIVQTIKNICIGNNTSNQFLGTSQHIKTYRFAKFCRPDVLNISFKLQI